ncbi:hypothetical protein EV421DRAFT_1741394 [Armillaria borealis]|uniref:DUF6534 domain-containing protein n=1 Tax=Armillaria borealis TaxID=47425 RepID=A0AA39J1E5_9AGAR|nr:hypothetical protein EV421DRAFT_1741394 [Armillaria borealis]
MACIFYYLGTNIEEKGKIILPNRRTRSLSGLIVNERIEIRTTLLTQDILYWRIRRTWRLVEARAASFLGSTECIRDRAYPNRFRSMRELIKGRRRQLNWTPPRWFFWGAHCSFAAGPHAPMQNVSRRTLSVDLELLKRIAAGNFVAALHCESMPSFNGTLAEEAAIAPSDLYELLNGSPGTAPILYTRKRRSLSFHVVDRLLPESHLIWHPVRSNIYYISFPKDNLTSKTVVYLLWLTETVQSVTNIYYTFDTFCYDFGNLSGLDDVDITWFTMPVLSGFVGCVAQLFYAWRMYKFSKKARWLCITLSVFSAAICCGIEVRNSVHYSNLQKNSKVKVTAIIWLGGSALCDTAIALCMTYLLSGAQTGLKSTRILLSRLIRLSVETGTITAAIAAVHMAVFLAYHNNNFHTAPANCLVKVYSNTVLAICNSRMTGRIRGGREDTTLHSFDSFDLSIGGLNIELRDTETNTNADSSLRPEFTQRSDDQEKSIGLNDRFLNTSSTADVLGAKVRHFSPSQADNLMQIPLFYTANMTGLAFHGVDDYH